MNHFLLLLLISFTAMAADNDMHLFQFKGATSIELKGTVDAKELNTALAPFGRTALIDENGEAQISFGIIEYPFFIKRFREVWVAGLSQTAKGPQYTYLYIVTNNSFPMWLNMAYDYNLPIEKGEVKFSNTSFEVNDISFSMGEKAYVSTPAYDVVRLEHYENKLVSIFTHTSEAVTKVFDAQTDKAQMSDLLRRLKFKPKLWVVRKSVSGTVDVPRR